MSEINEGELSREAAEEARDPRFNRRMILLSGAIVLSWILTVAAMMYAWSLQRDQAQRATGLAAEVQAACEDEEQNTGDLREICERADEVVEENPDIDFPDPDDPDPDDPELQEPELQEPEIQDPEDPDSERQDPEEQDAENQDAEEQEAEEQDGEVQDEEIQDEERDDPDPNDPDPVDDPDPNDPDPDDPDPDDPDPNDPNPVNSFTFQFGAHTYTCRDPDGDGHYTCTRD